MEEKEASLHRAKPMGSEDTTWSCECVGEASPKVAVHIRQVLKAKGLISLFSMTKVSSQT